MKKERKRAYFFAAILTIVLYLAGIFTGVFIQRAEENQLKLKTEDLKRSIENTQLEYFYLNSIGDKIPCNSLSILINETTENVRKIGQELVEIEKSKENIDSLKKEYSVLSVKGWLLNNYLKEKCYLNDHVILYFYSVPCEKCIKQGNILDQLRENKVKNMKVFVLDVNVDEPIVQTLKKTYNITATPAIIINEKKYEGLIQQEELEKLIIKN